MAFTGGGYDDRVDNGSGPGEAEAARIEAAISAEYAAARSDPDRVAAFRRVSRIAELCRLASIEGGELRAAIAGEIRDTGGLTLAGLADKIGISSARAQDLTDAAKGKRRR